MLTLSTSTNVEHKNTNVEKNKQTSMNAEQRYPDDMSRYWRKKYNALGIQTQEIKDNDALIPYL